MRIAIDAHMVGVNETGNETYTLNLIRALQALDGVNDYLLLTDDPARLGRYVEEAGRFRFARVSPATSMIRIPWSMPRLARQWGADVLHVTYNAPPLAPCPTVVSVHDISYTLYPDAFSQRDRLILSTLVPLSMRYAHAVVTLTEASKATILARYPMPAHKIYVTHLAASPLFHRVDDPAALDAARGRYGITRPFILAVGNLQPRKNLPRLVEAFARLVGAGQRGYQLVLAGKAQWQESEVYASVQRHGLGDDVVFTGYVPDDDLVRLYNAASVFVYPSLYEGFGLPPLEAMACEAPVVASNAAAIAEVVGDAGLLVPPTDVDALADALGRVLADPALRADLIERGRRRVARFSWRKLAVETLAVYLAAARRAG